MKIVVVFDSRHGFTEHCLGLLSGELPPGVDLWPVRSRPGSPDWASYDAVVLGGPVYFGRWSPAVARFAAQHSASLQAHRVLAAFVVSLSPRASALKYLDRGLPPRLKETVKHRACFGGSITWKGLAWWEKLILKQTRGLETDASNLDLPEIQGLAAWLSANTART